MPGETDPARRWIFPARVGMNRTARLPKARFWNFPRASGDEPSYRARLEALTAFSPREWG